MIDPANWPLDDQPPGSIRLLRQPIPLMTYSEEMINYGTRWGTHTSINLQGQLTGRNYNELMNLEDQLVSKFSDDFRDFVIIEDGEGIVFSRPTCKVESIDFEEGTHAQIANYNIKLSSFTLPQSIVAIPFYSSIKLPFFI